MTATRSRGRAKASTEIIRRKMSSQPQRDTKPELALRRMLHAAGYRFRVDYQLPGSRRRADIAFPRWKLAVFVDGCFWHSCPVHRTVPKRNTDWWIEKLEQNRLRDIDTNRQLLTQGWQVLRFWEHEQPAIAARKVVAALERLRSGIRKQGSRGRTVGLL